MPAFEFRDDDKVPPGYKKIDCHMVFDVKVDLTCKARLVAGGHQTNVPKDSEYSSVVSRDSVCLTLTLASLNGLSVMSADVQNANLNAPTKEICYTIAGPELGPTNEGRPVLIVRALYGLRSSGARWRDHLASTIRTMGFSACRYRRRHTCCFTRPPICKIHYLNTTHSRQVVSGHTRNTWVQISALTIYP
jgi:hypothetical protein